MSWWNDMVQYFERIGKYHHVNPLVYVGIHFVASPLFAASISWIFYNRKRKRSITVPVITAIVLFNTSNLYLIIFGNRIPFWIYAVAIASTVVGGWMAYKKIRKRMHEHQEETTD